MDAPARSRWRWAWFCPRCGTQNPAAADQCEQCGLEHALLNAPGPTRVHACGVASPAWAAYCIGCGEELVDGSDEEEPSPTTERPPVRAGDPSADSDQVRPPRPPRPHKILPPSHGPAEGLTLTRHVLLERSAERTPRPERFRLVAIVLLVALAIGLLVRVLAAPGDDLFTLVKSHRLPGRGVDALVVLEELHRLLAPAPTPPSWSARVEQAELIRPGGQVRLLVARVVIRNVGGTDGRLGFGDVRLVAANGLDVPAAESSAGLARAAGLTALGGSIAPGAEVTTLVAFDLSADPIEPRLKVPGGETPLTIGS